MKTVRSFVCLYAVTSLLTFGNSAQAIEWSKDYGTALDAARLAKKPLLVVLEMPSDQGSNSASDGLAGAALLTLAALPRTAAGRGRLPARRLR